MPALHDEISNGVDISGAGATILAYTYSEAAPVNAVCRVTLGSTTSPISGGGQYTLKVTVNGSALSPDSSVMVGSGITKAMVQSRPIVLVQGDVLEVTAIGRTADASVDVDAAVIDVTPLTKAEVFGSGAVQVDHHYGGEDRYRYVTQAGAGIDNAQVQAFLREDYNANNRGAAFVKGETRTGTDGRWTSAMMLDPGNYVLVFFKQRAYGPTLANLTVA